MNQKKYSLYFILGLIIVFIATISISLISSYKYMKTKEDIQFKIYKNSKDTLVRLKQAVAPYLESFSVSEYEHLLKNEMRNRSIYGIIIKDHKMAQVLGKDYFLTGKVRDTQWNIISYNELNKVINDKLANMYDIQVAPIKNSEGEIIGDVSIYSTDFFMEEELSLIIKESIIFIIVSSFLVIFLSFFLIHRIIIKPLETMIVTITQNSSQGISLVPLKEDGFKEIYKLSVTINKMISSIQESQEQQEKANKTLNFKVTEKTKELQDLNISLEKRIDEELEKSKNKDILLHNQSRFASMGEMIGNIAHQWRQPLNALSITIQKIQRYYQLGKLDEDTLDKSIDKAMNLIQKMSSTIDDFMGFFREDKVKMPFDIAQAIEETVSLLEASLKNNFIDFNFIKPQESIQVVGYKGEFTQVILNIVSNAKDALRENNISSPKIDIFVTKGEDEVIIEIVDNGGGVPLNIIDNIFDPYFTTKEEGKGTGIGLYMSKIIIEQNMYGELSVKNKNGGACFIVRLEYDKGDI